MSNLSHWQKRQERINKIKNSKKIASVKKAVVEEVVEAVVETPTEEAPKATKKKKKSIMKKLIDAKKDDQDV